MLPSCHHSVVVTQIMFPAAAHWWAVAGLYRRPISASGQRLLEMQNNAEASGARRAEAILAATPAGGPLTFNLRAGMCVIPTQVGWLTSR